MPRWPEPNEAAPRIDVLRRIDEKQKQLHCPVLLVGDGASTALEDMARQVDKEVVWTEAGFHYYRFALNAVRGYQAALHVYAPFESQLKGFLPHTNWLAIASRGPNRDPSWRKWNDKLTRMLAARTEIVVGLIGDDWLDDGWKKSGGREPIAHDAALAPVLKSLARDFLVRCRVS